MVLVPVQLVAIASLAVLLLYFYTDDLEESVVRQTVQVAELVEGSMYRRMLANDRQALAEIASDIAGQAEGVLAIRILDKTGQVVISNDPAEVHTRFDSDSPRCAPCHAGFEEPQDLGTQVHFYVGQAGDRVLSLTKPVRNRRDCWTAECHAHRQEDGLLGLLSFENSMAHVDERISVARTRAAVTTTMLVPLIMLIFIFQVRRTVHRTVRQSISGAASASESFIQAARQQEGAAAAQSVAADEAREAIDGLVEAASKIAERAQAVVDTADSSREAAESIGERIELLDQQTAQIVETSESIRKIADRSAIIALNAALEGTKAGELGRGIVVVGEELRRLADTVSEAVKEIKELARQNRELSRAAVEESEQGQQLAADTSSTAARITAATQEQRAATSLVARRMDDVQESARRVLEGAAHSKEIAEALRTATAELVVLLEGQERDGA